MILLANCLPQMIQEVQCYATLFADCRRVRRRTKGVLRNARRLEHFLILPTVSIILHINDQQSGGSNFVIHLASLFNHLGKVSLQHYRPNLAALHTKFGKTPGLF